MPRRRARRWAAVLLVSLLVACLEGTGPDRFEATPTGWIYFVFAPDADSGRTREVWRVRPTGDSLQRVAEPFPVTDAVRVSPDGRRLVLEVASNLFVLDLDTGAWAPITYSGDRFGAQWAPDGQMIANLVGPLVDNRQYRLLLTPANGGRDDTLVSAVQGTAIYAAAWFPSGDSLVYEQELPAGSGDFWQVHLDGTGSGLLATASGLIGDYPVISPDGRRLAYITHDMGDGVQQGDSSTIALLDLRTGRVTRPSQLRTG